MIGFRDLHESRDCFRIVAHAGASCGGDANAEVRVVEGRTDSGASFTNDFVELFNAGSAPVTLDGWTVQYASAAGTSWQATALAGSVAPGHHYLVQLSSAASIGAAVKNSFFAAATPSRFT